MKPSVIIPLAAASLVTLASLVLWLATGANPYTKFTVVERVAIEPDPNDPLAGTGFYDEGDTGYTTQTRDSFHFGLIPTPQGVFDKHALSVVSVTAPAWVIALAVVWFFRRRGARGSDRRSGKEPSYTPGM